MKIIITILIAVFLSPSTFCQQPGPFDAARIIFNGAYIVINKKADLVIQNTSSNALTVKSGGGIISEAAANNVIWNIANDSNYAVPFVAKDLTAIPVSFNTSNAAGTGSITFSTYSNAPDWKNSDYLPPGVIDVNRNGKDDSKRVIDRFWKIAAANYSTNPNLKNLQFSYRDLEWSEDSNSIKEKNLVAQNWNGTEWLAPVGSDKSSANYVKINTANNFFSWWCLVDSGFALSSQNFTAQPNSVNDISIDQKTLSNGIFLSQNFPNPFSNSTTISYSIPQSRNGRTSARIIITDKNGNAIKQISLSGSKGSVNVDASTLSSGAYQYSLYVDGRLIDTKQMVSAK
jgi:hypothetical protein